MQKCSHIPSRRELRVQCTLGWEAYGQPQAEDGGAGRNACINWNQYYNVCRSGEFNPHNGAINFDNIGYAWIAIFQVYSRIAWGCLGCGMVDPETGTHTGVLGSWRMWVHVQLPASLGHHTGGLGGHHVLRHGCSLILQLHLLHPPHHCECGRGRLVGILHLMRGRGREKPYPSPSPSTFILYLES